MYLLSVNDLLLTIKDRRIPVKKKNTFERY
jgi:hypothetical protein